MLFLVALTISGFGGGNGAIFLDEVDCNGQEERLEHCRHRGIGVENCEHSEDVGVICGEIGTQLFENYTLVLLISRGGHMISYYSHTEPNVGERCGYEDSQSELTREELERYTAIQYQRIHLASMQENGAKNFHAACYLFICVHPA